MRPHASAEALPASRIAGLVLAGVLLGWPTGLAPRTATAQEVTASVAAAQVVAILPFRIHSARADADLAAQVATRIASRLDAGGGVTVVEADRVAAEPTAERGPDLGDSEIKALGSRLGADAVLTGSLTELAGRFSLDARLTPVARSARSRTIVFTASDTEELLARLTELADQVTAALAAGGPARVVSVRVEGAGGFERELRARLTLRPGEIYSAERARADAAELESIPGVATVNVETSRTPEGVDVRFKVVRAEAIFGASSPEAGGGQVAEIRIRGHRRIEADAIRARIRTRAGEPLRPAQLSNDVREVFALGFFRDVRVFQEETPEGAILTFEVEENPVVRQISISGNDNLEGDKIREILTLTTGSTLDYPLLYENVARVAALYRAEGYYLAEVEFELDPLATGSVGVHFVVDEKDKLRLKTVLFTGNEAFSDRELMENFATKLWRPWSLLTSWFDKSGTYSEPIFLRDLRGVEKIYTDAGYLQVEVGEPEVIPSEEGLAIAVAVTEGPRFSVGGLEVTGDDTLDLAALRDKLRLESGEIFNRSYLTEDVEELERHYTDRGFYFASVNPNTRIDEENRTVDVRFVVEKGPLYFVRKVNVSGNTTTVDPVIRREMRVVEGQLYSARALQVSERRVRNLGFFEDVTFEPKTTEDPSQLDLDVNVVERPTGSFSFGAGFSSQDRFILTASLSQANLFGRGYAVSLSADIGGRTDRFFLSLSDPYFLGSNFSLGTTLFLTQVKFEDFEQEQRGVDFNLGHPLREDNTARVFLRYSFAQRKVEQDSGVNAAAVIFREILQENESSSLIGLSMRSDTRDDRLSPTSGTNYGATVEYAGLGGFANYLRLEGRFAWYLGAPRWLLDRSTFVFATKIGYVFPFNDVSDFKFDLDDIPGCDTVACDNVDELENIDTDIRLPLTERYFLGGLGTFQLRGFEARSVGPRRPILRRNNQFTGQGVLFLPVGQQLQVNPITGALSTRCEDTGDDFPNTQGDNDGRCNDLDDKDDDDFDDLDETDVIGGSSFITTSFEYRFPVSEEIGLQGVFFLDMGNAFAEGENLFNVNDWRYGVGGGLLWFSPFGPLQVVLGWPLDPLEVEDSPVFEFSVGGFGI
ncbi:MAG: outer membrane protein assembly factor BamA [Proteobacteria bacterium]|nr:outer membrane protein assembly factor BamA [Pseudomonadota bacterium]